MLHSVFRQMVRFPKVKKSCATSLALTLSLTAGLIAGCASAPEQVVEEPAPKAAPPIEVPKEEPPAAVGVPDKEPPVTAQPDGVRVEGKQPAATEGEMVTVSVYTIDDQCNDFVAETVQVPSDKAISEAVGKAMGAVEYNAFKLDSYQVNVTGNTAVVDMSLAPSSERQFVSLSSCEQRALFGSVEETLLNNPDWDVNAVKFTNGGKELIL